jgi:hypothetical protein
VAEQIQAAWAGRETSRWVERSGLGLGHVASSIRRRTRPNIKVGLAGSDWPEWSVASVGGSCEQVTVCATM